MAEPVDAVGAVVAAIRGAAAALVELRAARAHIDRVDVVVAVDELVGQAFAVVEALSSSRAFTASVGAS
jgi:hypothetical protein